MGEYFHERNYTAFEGGEVGVDDWVLLGKTQTVDSYLVRNDDVRASRNFRTSKGLIGGGWVRNIDPRS